VIVVVVAVAFATGSSDGLPWGAIIGVLVMMAVAWVVGRRHALPTDDDEEGRLP
jgi:LPXTG-motif cell wall-anchored protein